jgi:hypothetical protein
MKKLTTITLLDLIQAVSHFAVSDTEVVATVTYLVNSGKVRLCGNFAGAKIALPDAAVVTPQRLRYSSATVQQTAVTDNSVAALSAAQT